MSSTTSIGVFVAVVVLGLLAPAFGQSREGPGAPASGGRGGRGSGSEAALPPAQQTESNRILAALEGETRAVAAANSNLVAATFALPTDEARIAQAGEALARARYAWATQAAKLFAENQASPSKLGPEAIERLVQSLSGRGGRGPGGPPPGFGRGGGPPPGGGSESRADQPNPGAGAVRRAPSARP